MKKLSLLLFIIAIATSTANAHPFAGGALITSAVAIVPDSRSMFIRVAGVKTDDGIVPVIIHVDTRSREIINLYTHTADPDGYVRSLLHQLKISYTSD